MINLFEFQRIPIKRLPSKWTEPHFIHELNNFLQLNWDQRKSFYNDNDTSGCQQFLDLSYRQDIGARNYIGTIYYKGERINIFPKVFKRNANDIYDTEMWNPQELIDNLVIWLGYCDKLNFPFIKTETDSSSIDNLLELLITIYVNYVKNAINKTPFYRYEDVEEELNFIKGKINIADYSANKITRGKNNLFKCNYSKFKFDNLLNQIIKTALRLLLKLSNNSQNIKEIRKLIARLSEVSDIQCSPFDCDKIHLNKLQRQYLSILGMSKIFLMNRESNMNYGSEDSFCFLFPTELLFESFVSGYMKEQFSNIASIRSQTGETFLGEGFLDGESIGSAYNLREDIIYEKNNEIIVLDTKYIETGDYSHLGRGRSSLTGINTDMMRQIAFYCMKRNAKKGVLIFPLYNQETPRSELFYNISLDNGYTVPIYIVKVPFIFGNIESTKNTIKHILESVL